MLFCCRRHRDIDFLPPNLQLEGTLPTVQSGERFELGVNGVRDGKFVEPFQDERFECFLQEWISAEIMMMAPGAATCSMIFSTVTQCTSSWAKKPTCVAENKKGSERMQAAQEREQQGHDRKASGF